MIPGWSGVDPVHDRETSRYLLDVVPPLDRRVVPRDLDLKQSRRAHVRRQLGGALTTTAADTCTPPSALFITQHHRTTTTTTTTRQPVSAGTPSQELDDFIAAKFHCLHDSN